MERGDVRLVVLAMPGPDAAFVAEDLMAGRRAVDIHVSVAPSHCIFPRQ
jgi:hypothetical protein